MMPRCIQDILYLHHFVDCDRSTSISFYTTGTFTFAQVTAEILGNDVTRQQNVTDLYDWWNFVHLILLLYELDELDE